MSILQVKDSIGLQSKFRGMDHIDLCYDKLHFMSYQKTVNYNYNSRGFRDSEWPEAIQNKVWCIGDSFTVGIGQPYEETWPMLLEKKLNEPCIKIAQDGCSNDLISQRVEQLKNSYKPRCIIIVWSYFWRRFRYGKNVHFDKDARELPKHDLQNFVDNFIRANINPSCKILNYLIPDCMIESSSSWLKLRSRKNKKNLLKLLEYKYPKTDFTNLTEIEQLDYARDGHHFDISTCQKVVNDILKKY